jgi:RNA polymerase sigma-70 factor (ECF subfamily)
MSEFDDDTIKHLARRIRNADRKAFDDLFRMLYPRLVHYSMRYVQDRAAASDMVQDAFFALWRKRSGIDPDQSLRSYLYTAVRNRSLNWLQHSSTQHESIDDHPGLHLVSDQESEPFTDAVQDESRLLASLFRKWIAELPERRQEAFELSRFDGLTHDEIAQIMDVSPKTVNNHIVSALKELKERYEEHKISESKD